VRADGLEVLAGEANGRAQDGFSLAIAAELPIQIEKVDYRCRKLRIEPQRSLVLGLCLQPAADRERFERSAMEFTAQRLNADEARSTLGNFYAAIPTAIVARDAKP